MKTPFPALLIQRFDAPFRSVIFRPVTVRELFTASASALVDLPSTGNGGAVPRMVPFSDLASTPERAAALLAAESARVIAATFSTATDEAQSAAQNTAGKAVAV